MAIAIAENAKTPIMVPGNPAFRFSGHETFALRIAWIPKAAAEIVAQRDPLTDPDQGIVSMGLGKNMVQSLRTWLDAFQIAEKARGRWSLTPIADLIFGEEGLDPYLEDPATPWVLHWLIATNRSAPFWAWECLCNRWSATEFTMSEVLAAFRRQADQNPKSASPVTLKQHWEVFLHTYRPPLRDRCEDNLDSALSVLGLIRQVGERPNQTGKWEPVYAFDMGPKHGISQQLFAFFLHDWWNHAFPHEQTVPFREVVNGSHSPGRILKMQEGEIARRLSDLAAKQPKIFALTESTSLRQIRRTQPSNGLAELKSAYRSPRFLTL
jgi:hypothetical protein